jgi:O-antigen ligase
LAINNLELLRLDTGGLSGRDSLNELSTGRIENYLGALNEISNNPFGGVGSGFGDFSGVHNVLLRSAVEGGIPFALSVLGLLTLGLYRGWRSISKKNPFKIAAFLTVLSGTINSLFEPVAMLGSFNNAAFWWLCFAICVSANASNSYSIKQGESLVR